MLHTVIRMRKNLPPQNTRPTPTPPPGTHGGYSKTLGILFLSELRAVTRLVYTQSLYAKQVMLKHTILKKCCIIKHQHPHPPVPSGYVSMHYSSSGLAGLQMNAIMNVILMRFWDSGALYKKASP